MITKNKLFLCAIIASSTQASDNRIKLTVYVNYTTMPIKNIDANIVQENRNKCLALGLPWTDSTIDLVEIKPRYYMDKTTFVDCLCNNPRILNRAISACLNKSIEEKLKLMTTPQLPQYIPADALLSINIHHTQEHNTTWHLHGCTFDISLMPYKKEKDLSRLKRQNTLSSKDGDTKKYTYVHPTIFSIGEKLRHLFYITGIIATPALLYMSDWIVVLQNRNISSID